MSSEAKQVRMKQQDGGNFDELVRNHYEMALRIALRYAAIHEDAHDLVQESFVTAYERLHQLKDPEKFAGWLAAIVRNRGLMWQRCRSSQPTLLPAEDDGHGRCRLDDASIEETLRAARRQVIREAVHEALDHLTEEQRRATALYYLQGCDYRETARLLSVPVSAVRGRLERARGSLRKELSDMTDTGSKGWELGKRDLDAVRWAANMAFDGDGEHRNVNSILFDGAGRIVSTDMRRVFVHASDVSPSRAVVHADLGRMLRDRYPDAYKARLVLGENEAVLRLDNGEIRTPLVDGDFPSWEKVVPHEFGAVVISNVGEWLDVLAMLSAQRESPLLASCEPLLLSRTVMAFSPEEGTIRLSQGAGKSQGARVAWEAGFTLPARFSEESAEMVLAANATYLEQAIRGLGLPVDAEFEILLTGDASPFIIRAAGSDDTFVVTMPMQRPA